jgi:hypothetical protein
MTTAQPKKTAPPLASDGPLEPAVLRPANFIFGAVDAARGVRLPEAIIAEGLTPPVGALAAFTGTFTGKGFNTIFRPQSTATPTSPLGGDNVLELNLTSETLSFSATLGSVPNRGMVQGDIFLNGVPYLQTINDVTNPSQPIGIHFEPGLWMAVPATTDPAEPPTVVRMGSIPHGTTIAAQGTVSPPAAGKPTIPPVGITPTLNRGGPIRFASQTASDPNTARIPQDLSAFITAGTITQAILDDPNTVLRNAIASQNIVSTTTISVNTTAAAPLFGGGSDNIAFLLGDAAALTDPAPAGPNAQTLSMRATFWIETVRHQIVVPPVGPGHPVVLKPEPHPAGLPVPTFVVTPPVVTTAPRTLTFESKQIQYSQEVFLNFNGLTWPHVSVATLVPHGPVPVPWQ